jgi:Outer membrane efflux protein/Calcineurin-like phosphoesterase
VREAERTLAADTARIGVATADLYPTVSLGGNVGVGGSSFNQLSQPNALSFGVGPLISWSFPNVLAARARIKESRAQSSADLAQFDSTVLTALKEVEQALTTYNAELKRNAALRSARDQSETAAKLAKVQLDNGAISFPDYLQTERLLVQAEAELAASDQLVVEDQLTVFKTLGGGWEQAPAVKPLPPARYRAMRQLLLATLAPFALIATTASAQTAPVDHAWVQYVSGGLELRAITSAGACPAASIDGAPASMTTRAQPAPEFPVLSCALSLPSGARQVTAGAHAFTLPSHPAQRILIFGDSGCRLKGKAVQACNDPRQWPFAQVAASAAKMHADVVIHVGDYYYRESPCPANATGCQGSPHGDTWASWDADFFTPADPLFAAAPWVFARGNHEDCTRGAHGWYRFLDAGSTPLTCPAVDAAFKVDLGGLNLYVIDGADADDLTAPPELVKHFGDQLDALKSDLAHGKGWIVTHRPIWGVTFQQHRGPLGPGNVPLDRTEQVAVAHRNLDGVQMIVAGHVHDFAAIDFGPKRPAQLVAGTGGDVGEPGEPVTPKLETVHIDGMTGKDFTFERYGYLVLDRTGEDWIGSFYDMDDKVLASCRLHLRALTCKAEPAPKA